MEASSSIPWVDWANGLPQEMLSHIFYHVRDDASKASLDERFKSHTTLAKVVPHVCKTWKQVANSDLLWTKIAREEYPKTGKVREFQGKVQQEQCTLIAAVYASINACVII